MTPDTIHALVLILTFLFFLIMAWKYQNWNGLLKRLPLASFAFAFIFIVFGVFFICLCAGENSSTIQRLIPAGCLFIILLGIENKKVKIVSAILSILIAAFLSWHFNYLVYDSNYTTSSKSRHRIVHHILTNNKERLIKLSNAADKSYPSGWAEELFKESLDAKAGMTYRTIRIDAYRLWHSSFTDLYLKSQKTVYLWYPGGRLSEAADKIEWKEK